MSITFARLESPISEESLDRVRKITRKMLENDATVRADWKIFPQFTYTEFRHNVVGVTDEHIEG
jgi:hypothetical protein